MNQESSKTSHKTTTSTETLVNVAAPRKEGLSSKKKEASASPMQANAPENEWIPSQPTEKRMGLVRLTLDEGVKTTVIGQLYGLDFELEHPKYTCRVFFDYYNRRLKVLDYEAADYEAMLSRLSWLAEQNDFDKIFLKARADDWQVFLQCGYMLEGILRYYFRGEDAYVLSRFRSIDRVTSEHLIEESELIEKLMKAGAGDTTPDLPDDLHEFRATPEHIPALVELYRRVFKTYPSPLTHPDYILATMERNVLYRAIADTSGEIVSAASAEIDHKHSNAELTDCATAPSQRGKGLMYLLLRSLENDLRDEGIITAYSLARARSIGMNRVFFRLGHEYSGRLVNNCDIYGQFEDMNIWVKRLDRS